MLKGGGSAPNQNVRTWAATWTLLARCPRGHWVSPQKGFCTAPVCMAGNQGQPLFVHQPQSWPPANVYASMRTAVGDMHSGQYDTLIAHHHPKYDDAVLYFDADGNLVRELPPEMMAPAPAPVAAVPAPVPAAEPEEVAAPEPEEQYSVWDIPELEAEEGEAASIEIPAPAIAIPSPALVPAAELAGDMAALPATPAEASAPSIYFPEVAAFYAERAGKNPRILGAATPAPTLAAQLQQAVANAGQPVEPLNLGALTPEELTRWQRAQNEGLVASLQPVPGQPGVYVTKGGKYTIDLNAPTPAEWGVGWNGPCTCPDCQNRAIKCKHRLAAQERAAQDGVVLGAIAAVPAPTAPPAPAAALTPKERSSRIRKLTTAVQGTLGLTSADLPMPPLGNLPPTEMRATFEYTPQAKNAVEVFGACLRVAYGQTEQTMEGRCFALYGPPSSGKNEVFRAMAAAMSLPYVQRDINKDSDVQALLGTIVLEPDGRGGTRSVAKLGPVGAALASGAFVAVNEITEAAPEAQTLFHTIAQDGYIPLATPEGGVEPVPVHPSSVLGFTWNPKGDVQDRPNAALEGRMVALDYGYPDEKTEVSMLSRWVQGKGMGRDDERMEGTVKLVRALRTMYDAGELDEAASYRHMQHFYMILQQTGKVALAARRLRALLPQLYGTDEKWAAIEPLIQRFLPKEQYTGLAA